MERAINAEDRERIVNLGALEYDADSCAIILGWDKAEVEKLLEDTSSEFFKYYQEGKIKAQYVIDLKLFEQAQAGDIKSIEKLEFRKKMRKR